MSSLGGGGWVLKEIWSMSLNNPCFFFEGFPYILLVTLWIDKKALNLVKIISIVLKMSTKPESHVRALNIFIFAFQNFQLVLSNFHNLILLRFVKIHWKLVIKKVSSVLQISPQQKLGSLWNFIWWPIIILEAKVLNFMKIRA